MLSLITISFMLFNWTIWIAFDVARAFFWSRFFSFRWKYEGPSDSFKALVDMAAVHSSCRLCIYLATKIQEKEEKRPEFQSRPCKCVSGSVTMYHVYVRERGRFQMESVFIRYVFFVRWLAFAVCSYDIYFLPFKLDDNHEVLHGPVLNHLTQLLSFIRTYR